MSERTIITDIKVTIFARETDIASKNQKRIEERNEILTELGFKDYPALTGEDDFWLFYERYTFPKEDHDRIKAIVDRHEDSRYKNNSVTVSMDCLYAYEEVGTISLNSRVRISDPCYDMDTWCAGSLENVLPGTYRCFYQRTGEGRVAAIKVTHEDYSSEEYEPDELQNIDVGVDSGECGIYDEDYFAKNCKDKEWYESTFVQRDAMPLDDKAFISSSGYGDGSYDCFVARNSEGKIIAIRITFISFEDEDEGEE